MPLTVYGVQHPIDRPTRRVELVNVNVYPSNLTVRDVAMLQMLADGLGAKEIAFEMKLNHSTVRNRIILIRQMTKTRTNEQMIAWCFRNKVLD
jgi:DNA-binding NarL/FixJ family response regulator